MTCQTSVPNVFRAGDTVRWRRYVDGYASADGWTLAYRFASPVATLDVTGVAADQGWDVSIAATETAPLAAGAYSWVEFVKNATGERYTTATGECVVLPDLAAAGAGADLRSDAQKALDAINAKLAGLGGQGVDEYEIHGRRVKYIPIADLMSLRQHFQSVVNAERTASGQAPQRRRVLIGFGGRC